MAGGGAADDGKEVAVAASRGGGVRLDTIRIGAPQQLQRSTARSAGGDCGGGVLNTSSFSSAAKRLALGCKKP